MWKRSPAPWGSIRASDRNFLNAGLGFGGFCLPKDIQAFIRLAEKHGVDFSLLHEVEAVNKRRVDQFVEKVRRALWVVKDKTVGVLGLAFKPNTDDVRFAPAIEVLRRLIAEGAKVRASDPVAIERARLVLGKAWSSSTILTRPPAAPMPCSCSPSGRSIATWIGSASMEKWPGP